MTSGAIWLCWSASNTNVKALLIPLLTVQSIGTLLPHVHRHIGSRWAATEEATLTSDNIGSMRECIVGYNQQSTFCLYLHGLCLLWNIFFKFELLVFVFLLESPSVLRGLHWLFYCDDLYYYKLIFKIMNFH